MIFYFSGTGNTRWAAEQLARFIQEDLLFIPDEQKSDCHYTLKSDERIGFCFPTHGWQPPRIVREFIRHLHIEDPASHYCYALTTCGDSIGKTMEIFNKELQAAGLPALCSVFSLIMPESYVCLPFMYTDTPEREAEKIAFAKEQLTTFCQLIADRKRGEEHTVCGPLPWMMSHIVGNYFNKRMVSDRKFTVDAGLCIHCKKCEQACPTEDLVIKDGLPSWKSDGTCTCCLACYHHCPQHAINYGSITRKRGQYFFGHQKNKEM